MKHASRTSISEALAVLSEPVRLRILRLAELEELSVGEIGKVVQLPQSTVSRHLKTLADGGWLSRRSEGTATLYRLLLDDVPPASRSLWTALRGQLADDRLASDLAEDERRLASVLAERRQDSHTFFGRIAGQWDELRNDLFGSRFTSLALLGLLRPEMVVADLGCGTGNASELLAPWVRHVVAIDASEPMLDAARQRLSARKNVEFLLGELAAIPLPSSSVDAAVCTLVLHHVEDVAGACREMFRILRPGGQALIIDMIEHDRAEYRQTMGHRWLGFSQEFMQARLAEAGFETVRFVPLPSDTQGRGPGLFAAAGAKSLSQGSLFSDEPVKNVN